MIQSIKNDSLTTVNVITLQIRLKELEQFKNCFATMSSTAALLAGFCYGAMSVDTWSAKTPEVIKGGYMITTTASMSFGLMTIVTSVFCGMLGPGLALRGHKGADSVHQAVNTMRDEFRNTLNYFIAQLTIFQVSLLFKCFLLFKFSIAFGLAMIQFCFLIAFAVLGNRIFVKLYV